MLTSSNHQICMWFLIYEKQSQNTAFPVRSWPERDFQGESVDHWAVSDHAGISENVLCRYVTDCEVGHSRVMVPCAAQLLLAWLPLWRITMHWPSWTYALVTHSENPALLYKDKYYCAEVMPPLPSIWDNCCFHCWCQLTVYVLFMEGYAFCLRLVWFYKGKEATV